METIFRNLYVERHRDYIMGVTYCKYDVYPSLLQDMGDYFSKKYACSAICNRVCVDIDYIYSVGKC